MKTDRVDTWTVQLRGSGQQGCSAMVQFFPALRSCHASRFAKSGSSACRPHLPLEALHALRQKLLYAIHYNTSGEKQEELQKEDNLQSQSSFTGGWGINAATARHRGTLPGGLGRADMPQAAGYERFLGNCRARALFSTRMTLNLWSFPLLGLQLCATTTSLKASFLMGLTLNFWETSVFFHLKNKFTKVLDNHRSHHLCSAFLALLRVT